MTKKDYELIAHHIHEELMAIRPDSHLGYNTSEAKVLENLAKRLSYGFALGNKRFDMSRFLAACGFPITD